MENMYAMVFYIVHNSIFLFREIYDILYILWYLYIYIFSYYIKRNLEKWSEEVDALVVDEPEDIPDIRWRVVE
jgi:predicted membrane protein